MKILIDSETQVLTISDREKESTVPLYDPAAFAVLSSQWTRVAWSLKYYHTYQWMGVPILQLPEDLIRLQEVIFRLQPDLIIETGVFCGGSLVFAASLCESIGKGRVIGIERDLRDDARQYLASHRLASRISVIEGDSTAPEVIAALQRQWNPAEKVLVILDSDHSAQHVEKELGVYAPFVTAGSCLIVEDAVMKDLIDVPGGDPSWNWDNPGPAVDDFLSKHPEFYRLSPSLETADSPIKLPSPTFWPNGWLWRRSDVETGYCESDASKSVI